MASRLTKKSSEGSMEQLHGDESPTSSALAGSPHSSQAWQQREIRRKRLQRKSARAKQLRVLCGVGIIVTALILAVVHVEVKMLMKAKTNNGAPLTPGMLLDKVGRRMNEARDRLEGKSGVVKQPGVEKLQNQNNIKPNIRAPEQVKKQESEEKPKPVEKKAEQEIENLKEEIENLKKQAEESKKEPEKKVEEPVKVPEKKVEEPVPEPEKKANEPVMEAEKKAEEAVKEPETKVEEAADKVEEQVKEPESKAEDAAKDSETKQDEDMAEPENSEEEVVNEPEPVQPMPADIGVVELEDPTVNQSPELKEIVDHAKRVAHGKALVKSANFCRNKMPPENTNRVIPAVIVLGMEDTSTNLFWHVLRELTPGGLVHHPVGVQPKVRHSVEDLDNTDPSKIKDFFKHIKLPIWDPDWGKWIGETFCIQQKHAELFGKPKVLGFPWITTENFEDEFKAKRALQDVLKLPYGTVKIIRYRRNLLDTVTRYEQWLVQSKDKDAPREITLAEEKILEKLSKWEEKQKAIDNFLVENKIPHLVLDHEQLFPFDTYREMHHLTKLPRESFLPLNVDFNVTSLPKEKQPPPRTGLEQQWAYLMRVMKFTRPTSLQDVFNAAIDYDQHDGVFWKQEAVIQNHPKVREILWGSPYAKALRKDVQQPDYGHIIPAAAEDSELEKQEGAKPTQGSKLQQAINKAKKKAEETPLLKSANFCGSSSDTAEDSTPAIIVLGMEDTSTDLFWYILRQLTPDGLVAPAEGKKPQTKRNYEMLDSVDSQGREEFFQRLPESESGKWIHESFCLQQAHHANFGKPKVLGFPWITTESFLENTKATNALLELKNFPHGSVKIIRYRRNLVDTITRYNHYLMQLKDKNAPRSVILDAEGILNQLSIWDANQKAIDDFLKENQIPHVVFQHEELFPYDTFREMLHVTKLPKEDFIPLNLELDLSDVPKEEQPPQKNHLEQHWTYLLKVMKFSKPFTLQDIFNAGIDFGQHDGVFWKQQTVIQNYDDIKGKLIGSPYESDLRKEYEQPEQKQVAPAEKQENPPAAADEKAKLDAETVKTDNNGAPDAAEAQKETNAKEEAKENEPPKQMPPKVEDKAAEPVNDEPNGESDKLHEAVSRALQTANEKVLPKTANFCGNPQAFGDVMPAVIILGMEDTSTDLFWHVLSEVTPEGLISTPEGLQPPTKRDYEDLNDMDPTKPERFFRRLPPTNHGKWVHESFCLQQQHAKAFGKPTVLGFPWLTLGNLIANKEAIEALQDVKKMPKGSVIVIRYRRNVLDMVSRHEQHLMEVKENIAPESVTLDPKELLKRLTHWTSNQKEVDSFLQNQQIPHVIVDHEKLFPFNAWKDLVNATGMLSEFPIPLNVDIDYSLVPPDERPPERSELEQEWANLLNLMKNTKPTSLFDIFSAAKEYEKKDKVFWKQQMSIKNYPKIQQVLTGTHYQSLLRNLEYKHDYYGCACNDKEANKKKMWKGWKKVVKTDTK